jgi:thymidylate kinase
MHIAIEGIDGVGKSTAAHKLAQRLGFLLVEKPLHYLFDEKGNDDNYIRIRDIVNKSRNKKYTGWFYGLGNIFLYEHFKNQNIITDRHILSNYCWSGDESTDYIFDAIFKSIISYRCDTGRNHNPGKLGAIVKSMVSQTCHPGGDNDGPEL